MSNAGPNPGVMYLVGVCVGFICGVLLSSLWGEAKVNLEKKRAEEAAKKLDEASPTTPEGASEAATQPIEQVVSDAVTDDRWSITILASETVTVITDFCEMVARVCGWR